ncbi:hypothetical protein ACJ73_03569 [Blastomyces percursus]|uniref:Tf2-1-like SH3-like domain-containing protein n=1 Tax=Blastomyces percursus TaxID=1658174 RepID=A0A1J9Q9C0_9EURO|nr:hypothetical protein ACJ73_03569 [Blastomyces percursus]
MLKTILVEAKEQEEKYYNLRHKPMSFKIGDWVMLRSTSISTLRPKAKLDHRYLGPFKIIDAWGKQTYKLALTPQYRGIHPVFHVSLLEPYHARDGIIPTTEPILIDSEERWEVKDIIDNNITVKYQQQQHRHQIGNLRTFALRLTLKILII